jgi:hypothetical protein
MNSILSIRSNPLYSLDDDGKELTPLIELVVIHTDGKNYTFNKKGDDLTTTTRITETRYTVSPDSLGKFISGLKLIQQNMNALQNNAAGINTIIKQFSEQDNE